MTGPAISPPSPWDDEDCRCGHARALHDFSDNPDGTCTSPTSEWWERVYKTPCSCEFYRDTGGLEDSKIGA